MNPAMHDHLTAGQGEKLAYTVTEACAALGLGRTTLFDLLGRKEILSVKVGRRRLIPADHLHAYMDRLVAEQAG